MEPNPQLSLATRMEEWTSLGQQKRKPEFPVVSQQSHRNSKKNHMVSPSSQDEALARHSVSREVPRFILKFETVFGKLREIPKFPDIPVSLKGITEVPGTTSSEPLLPS